MPNKNSEHGDVLNVSTDIEKTLKDANENKFYEKLNSISDYKVPPEKKPTHTRIHGGKWYVEDKYLTNFYELVRRYVFDHNCDLDLVEVHKQISPVLIDLDLRYNQNNKRIFNLDSIIEFIKYYINIIIESYSNIEELLDKNKNLLDFHILLKDDVVLDEKNNKVKDGIHIVMPDFITEPQYQRWIRESLMKNYNSELNDLFKNIGNTNKLCDTIDKCVIFENGWQIYGCKKKNNYAYKLKYVIGVSATKNSKNKILIGNKTYNLIEKSIKHYSDMDLIKLYSIRNKIEETKLILNKNNLAMEKYINSSKNQHEVEKNKVYLNTPEQTKNTIKNKIQNIKIFGLRGEQHHLDYIHDVVSKCLSSERADNYSSWYEVGQLLHNIDYNLLKTWKEFSSKSSKYVEEECESYWNKMKTFKKNKDQKIDPKSELTFGSLIYWAKTDNIVEYEKIYNKNTKSLENGSPLYKLIETSLSATDADIANVIFRFYNGLGNAEEIKYICFNAPKGYYAEYNSDIHKWVCDDETNSGECLRRQFDSQILNLYNRDYKSIIARKIAIATEEDDNDEIERLERVKKKIDKITTRLKTGSSINAILKLCNSKFLLNNVLSKFDTSLDLIGFTNGVYDLSKDIFREGRPSDYIRLSTNIEYEEYHHDHPDIKSLMTIINKILPIERVREWFLQILSTSLSGVQFHEHFYILSGSGANGKSVLIDFIRDCFGEYYAQMNVSALCSKRASSTSADPELANLQGKRVVTFSEPSKDESINTGYLKYLTGGDAIQARQLYKSQVEFLSQTKVYLICNDIPNIPSDDDGTWRRVKIVLFPSKFRNEHDLIGAKYEFRKDPLVKEKLNELKSAFMWLLIDYFKKFKVNHRNGGLQEPPEVNIATARQKAKNNPIETFVENQIIITNNKNDIISITQLTDKLREYMQNEGHHQKLIPKREEIKEKFNILYITLIRKHLGKQIENDPLCIKWTNIKFTDSKDNEQQNNTDFKIINSNSYSDSDSD